MPAGEVLVDILVVLVAAKVAAELAERVGLPAVAAEIVAGILVGPSVLDLVGGGNVLAVLGELGAILLLLEVGLQMDVRELGAVGRGAMSVAVTGMVLPFLGGFAVASAFGVPSKTAVFLAAALTATSVGVTARVFGDLRALGSVEARTVLGAAVADDVLGLVVLTVVVRVATEGTVSVLDVAGILAVALAFLVLGGALGLRFAPKLFAFVQRMSRSPGTLLGLALAFALGFAELADEARLAPIVGAFVAGLALGRSSQAERIRRDLTPLVHVFVPVFFLKVGIDADIGAFGDGKVLALAGALLAVAVVGKVAAGWADVGSRGDRLLVGLGMIPRGEVGLIFAGLGLREGVLGDNRYAALLFVVLASTLVTPPLLRARWLRVRRTPADMPSGPMPEGGWLRVDEGVVELAGMPPVHRALPVAFEAATCAREAKPGIALVDWLASIGDSPTPWDRDAVRQLLRLLREGNARSWRFLETTGVLDRALPELADALRRRRADPLELDPSHILRFDLVERVHELLERAQGTDAELEHPEWLLLAALVLDVAGEDAAPIAAARRLVQRLDLGAAAEQEVAMLVGESGLLRAAATRPDGLDEDAVLQLAAHFEQPERARALRFLSIAIGSLEPWERERLDELHGLLQDALAQPELTGTDVRNLAEQRRLEAQRRVSGQAVERLAHAPRGYLLALDADALARHAALVEPLPLSGTVRVMVMENGEPGLWRVDLACRDRRGLLAIVSGALATAGLDVREAVAATWPDGGVVESFVVRADEAPVPEALRVSVTEQMTRPQESPPVPDATVSFDDEGSPWYTLCRIEAPDRLGLLHAVALAVAASGADVHSSVIRTEDGVARDRFELTDARGAKLDAPTKAAIVRALHTGGRLSPLRRAWTARLTGRRGLPRAPKVRGGAVPEDHRVVDDA